jgi:hypothetical protein
MGLVLAAIGSQLQYGRWIKGGYASLSDKGIQVLIVFWQIGTKELLVFACLLLHLELDDSWNVTCIP